MSISDWSSDVCSSDLPDWTLDGEFVTGLIASEIIKDVIARGIPLMRGRRHKPTRQRTVSGGGKQAQGLPPMAPCTTRPSFGVEDHENGHSPKKNKAHHRLHLAAHIDPSFSSLDYRRKEKLREREDGC